MNNKAPKRMNSKKQRASHRPSNALSRSGNNDSSLDFFDNLASLQPDDAISRMDGQPVASKCWLDEFPTNDDGYVQLLLHVGHDNAARAARESRFHDGGYSPCTSAES